MTQAIADFVTEIARIHAGGKATEHSYRPALQTLFNSLSPDVTATNEPKRERFGAPDFIFERKGVTIAHVEAKDVPVGLRFMKDTNREQQDRYRRGFSNLVYTNGLDWDFYRNGELRASVSVADLKTGIQPRPADFGTLDTLLRDTIAQSPQTITTPRDLAERMAGKAGLIKDILARVLAADPASDLNGQFAAFKDQLIHDITPAEFADIYAETIAYGMFAARLHDTTLDTFSRVEALELLPKSNPFLRSLFGYIAGPDLDDNIRWIIDDLAAVFRAADVQSLMQGFGRLTGQQDPFLHFYETFLAAYNPDKRKARGVWYTPEPVVNFIVRAVDEVLQTEFGLPDGLADTSKVTVDWDTGQTDPKGRPVTIRKEVHRVQILDPATGTGTFLAEVIKQIAPRVKEVGEGVWSTYIEQNLIPRLHGFELLMASYAMCHMKLDMILTELGYKPTGSPPRLGVYLTNSLEEGEREVRDLFMAGWLTREAREANTIKRQTPIMCVIGNPPYSGHSSNKGEWIMGLMEAYKKEPGGKEKLKERNPKWINDDYVKFIRFAEYLIEKTGEGVLGFITNHGYLDNPTFRGMRWHLLNTFDKIYVLDLHGNSNKREVNPTSETDKNVFDILTGVSIIIAVKKRAGKSPKGLATLLHQDFWGSRNEKYERLEGGSVSTPLWMEIVPRHPQFHFVPRNFTLEVAYESGFSIGSLFLINSNGIVTGKDGILIAQDRELLRTQIWSHFNEWQDQFVQPISYRMFGNTYLYNDPKKVERSRSEVMSHYVRGENLGLLVSKQVRDQSFAHCFVTQMQSEAIFLSGTTATNAMNAPLYLYPTEQDLDQSRRVNFDPKLYARLQTLAQHPTHGTPDEVAVFDYIYGVLHCPAYRTTYAEFLKIDFPRIPWPATPDEFWDVSAKGTTLRKLHLMDPAAIGPTPFPFKGVGDAVVDKPRFEDGPDGNKIWINATQYFDAAPAVSWTFYIGGYQPAQKWLKDRKGRALGFDDVKHYQRILKILSETDRIMQTITMTLHGDAAATG